MSRVAVITGGAGGMGLATAKVVGREHALVLCDIRQDRLDGAVALLEGLGIVGGGLHAPEEWADLDSVAPRLYLTLKLIELLGSAAE